LLTATHNDGSSMTDDDHFDILQKLLKEEAVGTAFFNSLEFDFKSK
jgi:hypothetical protein